ncbi:hypothetical protein TUM20249_54180 [Pseudomonas tohonis]|nr:hypothetical protein TUM20249_54180 [Pseudomonas tohonis]
MPDSPAVVVVSKPCVIVVEARAAPVPVMAYGPQGPAGRPGVGGADISPEAGNQLESRPNGLYVAPPAWAETTW